ncbi:MAG: diguanylate cyclase [Cellvibrio sp.]|nr:diguanylate cyclase [Cellvibrio sp.]
MVSDNVGIPKYAKGLLKLILSKVPEHKYEWDDSIPPNTEGRIVRMVEDGEIDIVWYASTIEFEERMRPIRVCLFKGLLGYRVLMIKKGTQHKFDGIKTIEDLRRVSLGQGTMWADTNVLVANDLNVVKAMKYEGLFFMLDGDRFDGFPRGIHEPWGEIASRPALALDVEQTLLLSYPNVYYFFVNKDNKELAEALEKGFRIALEDGSFDEYLLNDPDIKAALPKANLKDRIIIPLKNPSLPPKTPLDDKTLWFDPYNY